MSELYDSIPTPQRKAYEAHAAEAAEQAAAPVMHEIGRLAAQGAQDVIDEATRITINAGIVDSIRNDEPIDTERVLRDMPKERFKIEPKRISQPDSFYNTGDDRAIRALSYKPKDR